MSAARPTVRCWRWLLCLAIASLALPAPRSQAAEPGTNADLTWGISQSDVDRTVALMRDAGVRWVRLNISWKSVEPNAKGAYSSGYLSNLDSIVDKVRAAGIQIVMPMADSVPYWASADPGKYVDSSGTKHWNVYWRPASFGDYADALRYVVGRYSARGVHVYEVWNEPNLSNFWPSGPNASEYVQMLRAAYPAAKSADSNATVLAGALADNDYGYLDRIYRAGGGGYFDAVSTHSYPNAPPDVCWNDASGHRAKFAFCSIEEIRNVMVSNGDAAKPVWLTEFGWSTCDNAYAGCWGKGVSASQQAAYITGAFEKLESYPYVRAALQYNFRNTYFRNDDLGDFNAGLGLLRTDFTAKPSLAAFQAYTTGAATAPAPGPDPAAPQDPSGPEPATDPPPTILKSKLTLALRSSTATRYSAARSPRAATGQVVGATDGVVVVRLQRRSGGRWATRSVRQAAVGAGGSYSAGLSSVVSGRWRVRAIYLGTAQSPPSLPRTLYFKVG